MPWDFQTVTETFSFLAGNEANAGLKRLFDSVMPRCQLTVRGFISDAPWKGEGDEPLPGDAAQPIGHLVKSVAVLAGNAVVPVGGRAREVIQVNVPFKYVDTRIPIAILELSGRDAYPALRR